MANYNCYALMPDGTPVFDGRGQPDIKKGDIYVSVSQILAMEGAGDFLIMWALREFGGLLDPIKAHKAYMERVSDLGSRLHSYVELDLKGEEYKGATEDMLPGIESWHAFKNEHKIELIESEQILHSKKYKFAGTMDIKLKIDGELYIADLKTGSVQEKAFTQLAAYKYMCKEMTLPQSDDAKLLVLGGADSKSKIADGGKVIMHTLDGWYGDKVTEADLFSVFMCLRHMWAHKNITSRKFEPIIKHLDKEIEPMIQRFKDSFQISNENSKITKPKKGKK